MKKLIALMFAMTLFTFGASAKGKEHYEGKRFHTSKVNYKKHAKKLKGNCCTIHLSKDQMRKMRKKSYLAERSAHKYYKHHPPKNKRAHLHPSKRY